MQIVFDNVLPAPIEATIDPESEIWAKNITFENNKSYQIYAPSGKGKSTFIHLIYGLRNDFKGNIFIEGQNTKKINATQWAKFRQTQISVIFQDLRLFMELTAYENILLKAQLTQKNTPELKKQIEDKAEFLGVAPLLSKKAQLLSYGERQRIAIIRATMQPASFLLLDEPFSHLDPANIEKASKLLQQYRQQHQTSFLMTSLGYDYALALDEKVRL
ncbi:MAG: ATP-binding cassette domain-containing protein [Cytophagales bacterium]|nr:MAG: ATP-binding cassette domain-containing protein [Cytophagales bacterium]